MKLRAFLVSFSCLALLLASSSCGRVTAKWNENSIDGPWSGSGVHTREFQREYFAGIMDAGVTTDTAWTTAAGSRRDAVKIAGSIQESLNQLGYFERWPASQSNISGYQQRLAPFTFHIVAIDPTVVIMVPRDFGNPKGNRSTYDIVGEPPKQSFRSRYMLNYLEYGTRLPYHPDILWFSPEMGGPPAALTRRNDSEQEINHKRIRLVTKKEGDSWTTRRE